MGSFVFKEYDPDQAVQDIVIQNIPMACLFKNEVFYVRECYPQYYGFIMRSLKLSFDQITVTGTPGIGKSVFLIYFLQRYRREHPRATILSAAFNENNELIYCRLFLPGDNIGKEYLLLPDVAVDINIYDGAPNVQAKAQKLVSFTSPNQRWFASMENNQFHSRLIMPVWDLEELLEATEFLGLSLEPELIKARFVIFGGSVRYCLSLSDHFVWLAEKKCLETMEMLEDLQDMREVFQSKSNFVFHMFPVYSEDLPFTVSFNYKFASERVFALVNQIVAKLDQTQRNELVRLVKRDPELKSLLFPLPSCTN